MSNNQSNRLVGFRFHVAILSTLIVLVSAILCESNVAQDFQVEAGYESLFNGKDLTGWNILPTTEQQKRSRAGWQKNDPNAPPWPIYDKKIDFDGKTESEDGRFAAIDGVLTATVPPEGRKVQMLYTKREFTGNFTLKLEFRAAENADSGVFIKGKQLQCRDYPNAGPYKELKNFKSGDWNELVVVVRGNTAHCSCNGEVLETAFEVPDSGPIGIEGDRGKFEYRRIRIADGKVKPTNKASSWSFEVRGEGSGTIKEDGDAISFTTTSVGEQNWHVQAYQVGLELEEGASYTVSFEISSPDEVAVLLLGIIDEDDWHGIGLNEQIYCPQTFAPREVTFTATDIADRNRIGFLLGEFEGSVSVKNFSLKKN